MPLLSEEEKFRFPIGYIGNGYKSHGIVDVMCKGGHPSTDHVFRRMWGKLFNKSLRIAVKPVCQEARTHVLGWVHLLQLEQNMRQT